MGHPEYRRPEWVNGKTQRAPGLGPETVRQSGIKVFCSVIFATAAIAAVAIVIPPIAAATTTTKVAIAKSATAIAATTPSKGTKTGTKAGGKIIRQQHLLIFPCSGLPSSSAPPPPPPPQAPTEGPREDASWMHT